MGASWKWCYGHWRVLTFLPMMSFIARLNVFFFFFFFLQLTSGRLLLPTYFLTLRLLEIHSFNWYFAPFSRCKLCLHPKLSPLNTLDHAKWMRNDWDKIQFWSNIFLKYVENISIFTHPHSWNTDFSTHLMKYIWYSPKKIKYPLHIIRLTETCLWHINIHVDIFLFMTYLKAPLF